MGQKQCARGYKWERKNKSWSLLKWFTRNKSGIKAWLLPTSPTPHFLHPNPPSSPETLQSSGQEVCQHISFDRRTFKFFWNHSPELGSCSAWSEHLVFKANDLCACNYLWSRATRFSHHWVFKRHEKKYLEG